MASLRNVAALFAAITILQIGQGLLGAHMPLAFAAQGHVHAAFGVVAAIYSLGFMLGAAIATTMLARMGHIRVFAACASLLSVSTLLLSAAGDVVAWCAVRFLAGTSLALMFAAAESWISASLDSRERGGVVGVYMECTKLALVVGPFLALGAAMNTAQPWMVAAALASLAMVPVCMTSVAQPPPPKAQPLALVQQFHIAPAAVIGCFGAGLINAGVLAWAPTFAEEKYGPDTGPLFYAAGQIGSLILQWPAGRLSDRMDRRLVIAALTTIAGVAALALAAFGDHAPFSLGMVMFALWGAGALSFYGLSVAHMADRAQPGVIAQATSGLLFVWALGSVLGPLLQSVLVIFLGPSGSFWFAGAAALLLTGAMFWRGAQRPAAPEATKEPFAPKTETSVAAAQIAYGDELDQKSPPL